MDGHFVASVISLLVDAILISSNITEREKGTVIRYEFQTGVGENSERYKLQCQSMTTFYDQ